MYFKVKKTLLVLEKQNENGRSHNTCRRWQKFLPLFSVCLCYESRTCLTFCKVVLLPICLILKLVVIAIMLHENPKYWVFNDSNDGLPEIWQLKTDFLDFVKKKKKKWIRLGKNKYLFLVRKHCISYVFKFLIFLTELELFLLLPSELSHHDMFNSFGKNSYSSG